MAFMRLIMTASKLGKLKKEYVEEKFDSINISKEEHSKKKLKHCSIKFRLKIDRFLKRILSCFFFERFCYTIRHDGSCENYTLKSIIGFVSGFILTYIFFMFSVFQLNFTLPTATVFCSVLGCVLMIGMAFSTKVRCIVLLTLPQFFSQKGRQALLAYAFILAISGPARNALNNLGILSESLACGQEQLKQAVRQIVEVVKKPFLAIKEAIKTVVKTVKEIVKKIKEILLTIKRIIMAILKVIKAAFEFLGKIINICNKELGTPFQRCTRVFENAIVDCNAKLGPLFSWLCSLTYIVQSVCYLVKFLDLICMIVDFISDSVVGVVIRKVKTFIRHIRTMFYVRIKFSHSFQFQTNSSKTVHEIAHAMVAEVKQRTEVMRAIFKFMTSAAALFFIFIIFKVTYYRLKFLTSERFDNKYINKDFREIDMRRAKLGKETVLPLNDREMQIYVTVSSKRLAKSEQTALAKAASTLATASVKLAIFMAADYSLFWILNLIQYYGKFQSKVQAPNMPSVHIAGTGFLADLLKSIVNAFQPVGIKLEIDTVPCLPTPIPPNYDRYVQIATLILLCWVLTILEPYGLRLRHIVMCYYHPTRAKQRAIWLYNHIMRSRNSFLKFARRQLRRKVLGDGSIAKITCKEYLAANFKICRLCLGEELQKCCLLCGEVFRESDDKKPIKCQTPDCPGVYCEQCFSDLQNLCTVCLSPIEYGDMSDISEEKDSSEEEPRAITSKETKKNKCKRWFLCSNCCNICPPEEGEEETSKIKSSFEKKYEDKDSSDEESKLIVEETDQIATDEKVDVLNKTKDSDYYSSDSSTDYSYSYQYDKTLDTQPMPTVTPFKDVEKQEVPDYASMSSFREEVEEAESKEKVKVDKITTTASKQSIGTTISRTTFDENKKGRKVDFSGVPETSKVTVRRKKKRKKRKTGEERPLLDQESGSCTCSDSDASDRLQHLQSPVLELLKSSSSSITVNRDSPYASSSEDEEETCSVSAIGTETKSDIRHAQKLIPQLDLSNVQRLNIPDTSSSLDSEIKCNHEYVKLMVPELDLSSLTSTPRSCKNYVSDIFGNVKYDEVSESPKSTSSSSRQHTPSTVISSVKRSYTRSCSAGKCKEDRAVQSISKRKVDVEVLAKPVDNYKFEEKQRKKVNQYYKAVKDIPYRKEEKKKSGKFMRFVQKILPKRKTNPDVLPFYSKDNQEEVELKPLSVSRHYWDTPSSTTLHSALLRQRRVTDIENQSSEEEEGEDRVRGGTSGLIRNDYTCLNQCDTEDTNLSASDTVPLQHFSKYPRRHIEKRDVLTRYFDSIEDLTPTRDWNVPMTTSEQPKFGGSRTNQAFIRELPEKDTPQAENTDPPSKSDIVRAPSVHNIRASSSSNLSEGFCTSVLGVPCSIGDVRTICSTSRTSVRSNEVPIEQECLIPKNPSVHSALQAPGKNYSVHSNEAPIQRESLVSKGSTVVPKDPSVHSNQVPLIRESLVSSVRSNEAPIKSESQVVKRPSVYSNQLSTKRASLASRTPSREVLAKRENLSVIPEIEVFDEDGNVIKASRSKEKKLSKASVRNSGSKKQNLLPGTSRQCDCELIELQDEFAQTSPSSILRNCRMDRSVITIKSSSDISQKSQNIFAEAGTDPRDMERHASRTDKTVEATEKFPVKESSTNARTPMTSDKMLQTSDNSICNISKAATFGGSSEATPMSHSSASYSPSRDTSHSSCGYGCCKCPPPPPKFEDFPRRRSSDYDAGPRRSCPGYIEKYFPQFPTRPTHKPPPIPRRLSMDFPSNTGYSLREYQYRAPPECYSTDSSRSRQERPRSRQQEERLSIPSCSGDCECCNKRRPSQIPVPPQFRQLRYDSSTGSEPEDDEEEEEGYDEGNYYRNPLPNRHELPYQNNEDYMDLVQELEETLQSRNRNRVRRAMQEFERRSKYNKPLERPIIDYDETSESEEPIIQRISQLTSEKQRGDICSCRRETRARPSLERRLQPKPRAKAGSAAGRAPQMPQGEVGKTRWQMDMNSGEWYKVTGRQQHEYSGRRKSSSSSPRRKPCAHDCSCCVKNYDYR